MTFHTLTWHYTATYDDQDIGRAEFDHMHRARGFRMIGYHGGARLGGEWEWGRPLTTVGAHVKGHNAGNLGFYTVGGLRRATGSEIGVDTRTKAQIETQIEMTRWALKQYPTIKRVVGHRDLAATQCPGYDVAAWWRRVNGGLDYMDQSPEPGAPARTRPMIRLGSRGAEVKALQTALRKKGFQLGEVDGIFGRRTEGAVRAFQLHAGIGVDGIVGNVTWAALLQ